MRYGLFPSLLVLLCPSPALAHHAKEYLVTGSYELVHPGDHLVYLSENYEFENADDSESYHGELTPGWIYGITERWQAELHFHVIDPDKEDSETVGKDGFVESVAPSLKYAFPERANWPVDVALAVELEIPMGDGERAGTETQTRPHLILRRVWQRGLESTLDLEGRFELTGGQHTEWGLALATKKVLAPWVSAGVEFQIPADGPGAIVVPGLYLSRGRALLKLGVGVGLTSEASDLAVLSSASYQF